MCTFQAPSPLQLKQMPQLAEAVDSKDVWTGLTDAASRRKRQNRLNVRAYRRRKKASQPQLNPVSVSSETSNVTAEPEALVPCWVEDQQTVQTFPVSKAQRLYCSRSPLLPSHAATASRTSFNRSPPIRVILPLSPDHLITLIQFNVLRGTLVNRHLISPINSTSQTGCSSSALHIFPDVPFPQSMPPSLQPTSLQRTVPHEEWIDIVPHPIWRDNLIRASGSFDEDDLWADILGGLFEGFPASEVEQRGIVAWSTPWHSSGWEVSEGFLRKWGWSITGCEDVLQATNRWRKERGDEPLGLEL